MGKYWWEEDDQQAKDQKNTEKEEEKTSGYWWEDGNIANTAGTNITNRVNSWLKNHSSYISDYQNRYSGRKGTYEDSYVSDSASWLDKVSKQKSNFDAEADSILAYMDQYKGYLDAKWMDDVRKTIAVARDQQKGIYDSAVSDNQWWSSFKDEDDYNFWRDHSTVESRQAWYAEKKKRLDELKAEKDKDDDYVTRRADELYQSGEYTSMLHAMQTALEEYNNEIEALETDIRNYERGNYDENGRYYGRKVVDDYSSYSKLPDFNAVSSSRNTVNPTREDLGKYDLLNDSSTWNYDNNGILRDADGNEIKKDASGRFVNPKASEYAVKDRLGIFLGATDEEREEYMGTIVGGTWGDIISQGIDGSWDQLEEDEVRTYYYILNSEGKESADKFLDEMKPELNRREAAALAKENAEKYQNADFFEKVGMNIATVPAQLLSGIAGAAENASYMLRGQEINPYSFAHSGSNYSNIVRGETAADLDSTGIKIPGIDFTLGDAYQAGMSILDSYAAIGIGGQLGGVLLATGAASSEATRLYEQGATREQIALGSAAAGAAEMVFESLSIDKLINMKDAKTVGQIIKNALVQGGIEASEEGFTEIANIITNSIIMGNQSDWNKLVEKYNGDEFSAFLEKVKDVVRASLSGFISGTGSSAVPSAVSYAANKLQQNAEAKQTYGEYQAEIVEASLEIDPDNAYAKKLQAKLQGGKDLSGRQLRKLVEKNTDTFTQNVISKIQESAKKRLTDLGETSNVDDIAKLVAKQVAGEELTRSEVSALVRSQHGSKVAKEIRDGQLSVNQESRMEESASMTSNDQQVISQLEEQAPTKVAEDGVTIQASTGNEISPQKIVSIDGGEAMIQTDSGTISANDIAFGDENTDLLWRGTASFTGITPQSANGIIRAYLGNESVSTYLRGAAQEFQNGYYNKNSGGVYADKLTPAQREIIYGLGQKSAGENTAKAQAKATAAKRATVSKTGKVGKVHFDFDREGRTFDAVRETALTTMEQLSAALGVEFYVYESYRNAARELVYKDASGNEVHAPNGYYDPSDGSIHIDLNAGATGKGTMLFTVAHELTHFIKQWSPAKFKVLANVLVKQYSKNGATVDSLVEAQLTKAKNNKRELTWDEAFEEVVADSMESILTSGNVVQAMAEVKKQDKGLWKKICDWFKDLAAKLRAVTEAYKDYKPDSKEGKMVAEMRDVIAELEKVYTEALVEASDNFQAAQTIGFELDAETESVSPAVLHSERTWNESDYVQQRDKAAKEIAKAIGVTEQKAKDYIDSINSIAKMIAEDRSRLDFFSSPGRSSFVDNAEYGGSFDFSTLCKKRRLLTGTFTAIQKALPNTALTADEILDIRNRMKEANLEVSCGLCYVEGSRANMGQFAKEFLRLYKQYYPDAWQPNMADVNTPDGIEWVRINHPECYEQYEYFWNHYGTLKPGDKNLFASQQKPKLYQLHTEYKGEILNRFKNDDKVEEKNLNGGIRLQSFSDFEIVHLIDTMQIIMDMSRVGLAGQAYTKMPDFAWALGDTGLKINLSLIAKGVDENGKLIFDDVEGMPIAEAMKLRDRYSKNVGTILVAFNDEQLLAAMADDRVDFIIPFHRSQWKKSQYEAMGLPAKTKDYTFMQNEKYIKPQFHEYRGRMVKDKATNYMPNEYWDFSKSGKENAEAYLEMCARNNKRPKFYKLLQNNGDGSYSLKSDGSTDGYWKLLIDFKMYDNEGNGSPQMPVKPEFNMEEATRMLNDYSGGHSNFPVAQGIVDGFVKDYKASHKGVKFSDRGTAERDQAYMAAVERGDMETVKKMVYEAAKRAGYTVSGHHGTNAMFNKFSPDFMGRNGLAFGPGFYFTTRRGTASSYEDNGGRIIDAYLKVEKSLSPDEKTMSYSQMRKFAKALAKVSKNQKISALTTLSLYSGSYTDVDIINNLWYRARDDIRHEEFFGLLRETVGYDSVKADFEGANETFYVVFNADQIKSADPVTYDDDGNVIPLSKRFNAKDDDIRYSERDSRGKQLTKEQVEFFKDSVVRDNKGNLKVMYHGTNAEFTVFDKSKLRDKLGFFFTDYEWEASDYGTPKKYYLNISNPFDMFGDTPLEDFAGDAPKYIDGKFNYEAILNGLMAAGYDGMRSFSHGKEWYVAFSPEQIKDVSNNKPTSSQDTRYSDRDPEQEKVTRLLEKENADLKEDVAYLRELVKLQSQVTDGTKFTKTSVEAAAGNLIKSINAKGDKKELAKLLNGLYEYIANGEEIKFEGIKEEAQAAVNWLTSRVQADETPAGYSYDDELFSQEVMRQVYDSYWNVSTLRTVADKYQKQINQLKYEHSKRMSALREYHKEKTAKLKKEHKEKLQRVRQEYRERMDKQYKDITERYRESRKRENARRKEAEAVKKNRAVVEKAAKVLMDMLAHPTKDAHVPTALHKPLQEFLEAIDFSSKTQYAGKSMTIRDVAYTRALAEVRAAIAGQRSAMEGKEDGTFELDIPDSFLEEIDTHIRAINSATKGLDLTTNRVYDMTSDELADLGYMLKVINKAIRDIDKLHIAGAKARVSELGQNTRLEMSKRKPVNGESGGSAMWANYTPWHAFRRMGKAAQQIFKGLMQGQAKLARTINSVIQFTKTAYTVKEAKAWERKKHTINLDSGKTISMTPAQIMSFYCLSKREHAMGHMMGGGIRISTIKEGARKLVQKEHYTLTEQDIVKISNLLTDRQRAVAEQLQQYMQDVGGRLNNEISMARWDYMAATEEHYFPIKTDDSTRDVKDPGQEKTNLWALLNKSFTKGLTHGANNAMVVESIFDVFADHMSEVAEYNAFALPLVDAMKWFNYRERIQLDETHIKDVGVQKAIRDALGTSAVKYFVDLMTDINSSQKAGRHENLAGQILSRSKVASVGWNLRVAIQQPTAILRASMILDVPSLLKGTLRIGTKDLVSEMQKYSGIALWKSMGYYDLNVSRSVREQIKGDDSLLDKFNEFGMWLPGKMDEITWARIWAATKVKVAKEQKLTGEALLQATAELFEEIVYQTQVADSVLTRSSMMRSKSQFMKEATAFMAESTVSANILLSAFQDYEEGRTAWDKTKRGLMIGFCGYAMSSVVNAIATALMDAWRDDDEYEEYWEKFRQALLGEKSFFDGNLFSELNPLEKIVFVKDFLSLLKGYDVTPGYAELFQSAIDLVDNFKKLMNGKGSITEYGVIYQSLHVLSGVTGFGASNIAREVIGVWNNTIGKIYPNMLVHRYDTATKSKIRNAYDTNALTDLEAMQLLIDNGVAENEDEAKADVEYWKFQRNHPDIHADDQWFHTYYKKVSNSGIGIELYIQYRNKLVGVEGKEDRMAVIHTMPMTKSQKDALYLAEGWSQNTIGDAPWH